MKPKVFHQKITCKEFSKSSALFQILFQICFPKNKTRNLIHRNENWRLSWCAFQRAFSGKYKKNLIFPLTNVDLCISSLIWDSSPFPFTNTHQALDRNFQFSEKNILDSKKKKCLKNRFLKCMWFHNFIEWLMISPIDKCQWNFVPKQIIHSH